MDSATSYPESLSKETAAPSPEPSSNEISDHPEQTPEPPQISRHNRRCVTAPSLANNRTKSPEMQAAHCAESVDLTQAREELEQTDRTGTSSSSSAAQQKLRRGSTRNGIGRSSDHAHGRNETLNLLEAGLRSLGRSTTVVVPASNAQRDSYSSDAAAGEGELDDKVAELSSRVFSDTDPGLADVSANGGVYELGDNQSFCLRLRRLLLQFGFAVLLGSLVGLVTVIFHVATEKVEELHRFAANILAEEVQSEVKHCVVASCERVAFGAWMALGTCLAALLVGWISQCYVPECIGGGTIATKICLAVGSPVPVRVGLCRFLLSTVYVGAGNALGIEAPTLHISASVASALHNVAAFTCSRLSACDCANNRDGPPVAPFFTNEGLPQAVVLGCAAGLSAAFRSPLAAISYAVEEYVDVRQTGTVTALVLLSSVSSTLVCRIFEPHFGIGAMSISSSVVSDSQVAEDSIESEELGIIAWLVTAMFLGLLLGTLSPLMNAAVLRLRSFCHVERSLVHEVTFAGLAGVFTGVLGCGIYLLTSCESAWGFGRLGMVFNIRRVCDVPSDAGVGQEVWKTLVLACGKLLAFAACFATGGPGGVLMPSLFVGALLGRSVGHAAAQFDSALPYAGTIFGMAALFSANMRLPLTAATVALEFATADSASYDARLICTVPLAAALATWMSSWWDPLSIHERSMFQDGINPFTLSQQIQAMVQNHVEDPVACPETSGDLGYVPSRAASVGSTISQASLFQTEPCTSPSSSRISGLLGSVTPLLFPSASHRPLPKELSPVQRSSMRMIVAAQRRSILFAYADPTRSNSTRSSVCHASFISSPDEVLFASREKKKVKSTKFGAIFPGAGVEVEQLRKQTSPWAPCRRPSVESTDTSNPDVAAMRPSSPKQVPKDGVPAQTSQQGVGGPQDLGTFGSLGSYASSRKESKDSLSSRRVHAGTPACSLPSGSFLMPPGSDRSNCSFNSLAINSSGCNSVCNGSVIMSRSSVSTAGIFGERRSGGTIGSPGSLSAASSWASSRPTLTSSHDSLAPEPDGGVEGPPHPRLLGHCHIHQKQQPRLQIPVPKAQAQSSFQRLRSILWPKASLSPGLELYTLSDEDDGDAAAEEGGTGDDDETHSPSGGDQEH